MRRLWVPTALILVMATLVPAAASADVGVPRAGRSVMTVPTNSSVEADKATAEPSGDVEINGRFDETLYRSVLIAIAMRFESATQMERLIRWVRAIFGTTIAGQVAQHATIIADRFWSILGSDRVTPQVVQDSIYRLMIDARVTPRVATSIALAIKQLTLWYMNL